MFAESPDQQLFEQVTASFLDAHHPIGRCRELAASESTHQPGWWREAAALGWTTLLVPEDAGGGSVSGNGLADLLIVAAHFGRRAAPGPLLGTNIMARALGQWGSPPQRGGPLAELLSGEAVGAWAHETAGGPTRGGAGRVTAVYSGQRGQSGAQVVLNGAAGCAEGAADAKYLLLTAVDSGGGRSHYLVPVDAAGVELTPLGGLDLTRRFSGVTLRDVTLPAAARVGAAGNAAAGDARLYEVLAVLLLGEIAGAVGRAFEMTADWVAHRYSFGRPLSSYQEVKHRMADMRTEAEAIEAVAARSAFAVGTGAPDGRSWAWAGLAYAGRRAPEIIQDCIQLHGGIGVTFEHDLHLLLRRVAVDTQLFGTPGDFARQLGTLVADAALAGEQVRETAGAAS
jgi:alkylation response protein AidB-like acyl-CoA dehydrogenase